MRVLIFIASILFLLWVICGFWGYFIIRHICIRRYGKKPSSFIRVASQHILAGPLGLITMIWANKVTRNNAGKCLDGNCFNGQGTILYSNGEKYIGQWKNGKYNGKGSYIYPDGKEIKGYWKEDDFIGKCSNS